mmetsp:Transcript_59563/g.163425  ORF Transcript_59563/g.163425 Transcript_59563/m.163425 type:complete len:216 (+) Transcript_59563:477-1124(+)
MRTSSCRRRACARGASSTTRATRARSRRSMRPVSARAAPRAPPRRAPTAGSPKRARAAAAPIGRGEEKGAGGVGCRVCRVACRKRKCSDAWRAARGRWSLSRVTPSAHTSLPPASFPPLPPSSIASASPVVLGGARFLDGSRRANTRFEASVTRSRVACERAEVSLSARRVRYSLYALSVVGFTPCGERARATPSVYLCSVSVFRVRVSRENLSG